MKELLVSIKLVEWSFKWKLFDWQTQAPHELLRPELLYNNGGSKL